MHDRTLKAPFVLSVLSICLGIFAFLLGIHEMLTEPATPFACSMTMTMLGGGYILGGCWGVCISRKQNREFVPGTIVVHEPDNVVVVGRVIWFLAVFYFFITFGCCISNNISGSFDVCMAMITLAVLFLAFWIFSDYRYRCIVLFQDCIEYTNSFGKKKSIYRAEVRRAKWNSVTGRYRILDMEENKLFSFRSSMINSGILIGQFPSVFQNCMIRQEKEEIEDPFEKKYSEEYLKKVRSGGLILCYVVFGLQKNRSDQRAVLLSDDDAASCESVCIFLGFQRCCGQVYLQEMGIRIQAEKWKSGGGVCQCSGMSVYFGSLESCDN